jgi:hypothetical protein
MCRKKSPRHVIRHTFLQGGGAALLLAGQLAVAKVATTASMRDGKRSFVWPILRGIRIKLCRSGKSD